MKRVIYLSILAVLLAFFITLVFSIVSARRAAGAEAEPVGAMVVAEQLPVKLVSSNGITSIYEATYAIHIAYPCCGRVATKKLWIRAEWWEAEKLVRIKNANSPNIIYPIPKAYLFSWERLEQDLTASGWGQAWLRFSISRLWCKIFGCYDWKYELECAVYGQVAGYFNCSWLKW